MDAPVLTAALATVGVLVTAAMTAAGVILGQLWTRITQLEQQLDAADHDQQQLWLWMRAVADLYYRHRKDGAPGLPTMPTPTIRVRKETRS